MHINLNLSFLLLLAILLIMFLFLILLSRLDLAGTDVFSLSANHLQKFRLSFQLITPHGHAFKPHQVCKC